MEHKLNEKLNPKDFEEKIYKDWNEDLQAFKNTQVAAG